MGLLCMALIAALCLYTAFRIIQVYDVHSKTAKISEFNDLCGLLLGRWASNLATIFSVLAIVGAAIVYWVLLSNFLYSTVDFIHGNYHCYCCNFRLKSFKLNFQVQNFSIEILYIFCF